MWKMAAEGSLSHLRFGYSDFVGFRFFPCHYMWYEGTCQLFNVTVV